MNYNFLIKNLELKAYNLPNNLKNLFIKKFYLKQGLNYSLIGNYAKGKLFLKKGFFISGQYKRTYLYKIIYYSLFIPFLFRLISLISKKLWCFHLIKI